MKAVCIQSSRTLAPFGDPASETPILNRRLADVQRDALRAAGVEPVDQPPHNEAYLVYSDRTWFTADAIRRLVAAGLGRMWVDHDGWWGATGALQDTPQPGLYELAVIGPGQSPSLQAPPVAVDLALTEADPPPIHTSMRHALRPLLTSAAMVHQIDHWSHIVRVNQLALAARAEQARADWEAAGIFRKIAVVLGVLWRSRSIRKDRILRALCEQHGKADIHPTAVVELCVLGDGVQIGPHAVVRASVIADGVKIEDHATVNLSSVGEGAVVGRYAMVNLSTLYAGAMASCNPYQSCVIGKDAFVAWGVYFLDLSFGKTIRVHHDGQRVDSELHFLGSAIGHRARIGNGVRVNYGVEIPNDTFLVAPPDGLVRDALSAPPDEAVRWVAGGSVAPFVKVRKGPNGSRSGSSEQAETDNGGRDDRTDVRTDPDEPRR